MRYIVYAVAIFGAVLAIAFGTGTLPRDATASHNETNDKINVLQLDQANGAKVLPQREISDEVHR